MFSSGATEEDSSSSMDGNDGGAYGGDRSQACPFRSAQNSVDDLAFNEPAEEWDVVRSIDQIHKPIAGIQKLRCGLTGAHRRVCWQWVAIRNSTQLSGTTQLQVKSFLVEGILDFEGLNWSGRRDLNPGPLAPQNGDLVL
jgi:hypothetical protein